LAQLESIKKMKNEMFESDIARFLSAPTNIFFSIFFIQEYIFQWQGIRESFFAISEGKRL
jgi:hypothetical protein